MEDFPFFNMTAEHAAGGEREVIAYRINKGTHNITLRRTEKTVTRNEQKRGEQRIVTCTFRAEKKLREIPVIERGKAVGLERCL